MLLNSLLQSSEHEQSTKITKSKHVVHDLNIPGKSLKGKEHSQRSHIEEENAGDEAISAFVLFKVGSYSEAEDPADWKDSR